MKLVIYKNNGTWMFSPKDVKNYLKFIGETKYFYKIDRKDYGYKKTTLLRMSEGEVLTNSDMYFEYYISHTDLGKEVTFECAPFAIFMETELINPCSVFGSRENSTFIEFVELNESKNIMSGFKVVEFPDDVNWEIEDYDGCEYIVEKHRKWG